MSAMDPDQWPDPLAGETPTLTPVALTVDVSEALYTDDGCYCGEDGWVRFTKGVRLTQSLTAAAAKELGTLLYAEWVDDAGTFWRIAPDPAAPGMFKKFAFREAAGDQYFRESITVFGDSPAQDLLLKFHVYWTNPDDGAVARAFDVFAGFATKGAK